MFPIVITISIEPDGTTTVCYPVELEKYFAPKEYQEITRDFYLTHQNGLIIARPRSAGVIAQLVFTVALRVPSSA